MCALMVQHGCDAALKTLPSDIKAGKMAGLKKKAYSTLILCLGDYVLREVTKETTVTGIWTKLNSLYMTKSLANRLYPKKKLYTYYLSPYIVVWEGILDNGGCFGDSEFKSRGKTDKVKCFICHSEGHLKRDCPMKKSSGSVRMGKHDQDCDSFDDKGNAYFGEALVVVGNDEMTELVMNSGGSYHMTPRRDFLYDFKSFDGGSVQWVITGHTLSEGQGKGLYCEDAYEYNQGDQMLSSYDDWDIIVEYLVNISKRRAFWSLNEDILKITILKTKTPYSSRKIRREEEMLDEGDNWGIDPLEFISRVNLSFDKHIKIDVRTKKVLFHAWMNGSWNKRRMDDSILSNNNITTDSFFKPYLITSGKCDTEKEDEQSQTKRKYSNTSINELPNKRTCKAGKFEAIRYSLGPNEDYIATKRCEYDIWDRNEDNMSKIYQDIFQKKDNGWKDIGSKEISTNIGGEFTNL
ncbi:retrovirus-related pol polyprotein from transposon TNT 1-94 [Tanacetum coccineum]